MVAYLVVGRILIWAMQQTPLLDGLRKYTKLQELLDCDFCLGCWVYALLALLFQPRLLTDNEVRYPLARAATTGLLTSFVFHLVRLGWEVKFNAVRDT